MENVKTERLFIRRMAETDLQDFLAYQTHPVNQRYLSIPPDTEASALRFLARQATGEITEEGYFAFAVTLPETGRMIGEVGLGFSARKPRQGEMGWSFHPDFHRRGYATEAACALLVFAFRERNLHRVTAGCDAENVASFRLMERLGMRREGYFRESEFRNGTWHDSVQYALLRDEWLAAQTGGQRFM